MIDFKAKLKEAQGSYNEQVSKTGGRASNVPEDRYIGDLISVKVKQSDSGSVNFQCRYSITEGPYKKKQIFSMINLIKKDGDPNDIGFDQLYDFFDVHGIPQEIYKEDIEKACEIINTAKYRDTFSLKYDGDFPKVSKIEPQGTMVDLTEVFEEVMSQAKGKADPKPKIKKKADPKPDPLPDVETEVKGPAVSETTQPDESPIEDEDPKDLPDEETDEELKDDMIGFAQDFGIDGIEDSMTISQIKTIILNSKVPESKLSADDIIWLREKGLEKCVQKRQRRGRKNK
jgi:hypothetical protein